MTINNQELGQGEAGATGHAVDFAFLSRQTFDDPELQRDVLTLFVTQARRIVPTLAGLGPREQGDAAHLLKGSARGIGAWGAAEAASLYEAAAPDDRGPRLEALKVEFQAAEAAIAAYLETGVTG